MSYKSKRMVAGLLVNIALVVGYVIYAFKTVASTGDNLQVWALAMLVFIGASIVAIIIIQIIFNIVVSIGITVREADCDDKKAGQLIQSSMMDDEMDKLIVRRANYATFVAIGIGFIAALAVLALGLSAVLALHLIFGSLLLGAIIGGVMSIYYYEVGISHA